jgi:hypothetical protein
MRPYQQERLERKLFFTIMWQRNSGHEIKPPAANRLVLVGMQADISPRAARR